MLRVATARTLLLTLALGLFGLPAAASADPGAEEVWVLIDSQSSRLSVMRGEEEVLREFQPISVGRRGVAESRLRGDKTTPLGEFRINRVNYESDFHLFLGLNFPRLVDVRRAYRAGIIERDEYLELLGRWNGRADSPQDTVLGGGIGIHGIGDGDPDFHRAFNWTRGCIALTDEEIDELYELVSVGTRVIIR